MVGDKEDSPVRWCELFKLMPPRKPELRETVQAKHELVPLVTCLNVMYVHILSIANNIATNSTDIKKKDKPFVYKLFF